MATRRVKMVPVQVEPPRKVVCPSCKGTRVLVAYSTLFREHGFRRVTGGCAHCGFVVWWDEVLEES